jgi:hypothetical protein
MSNIYLQNFVIPAQAGIQLLPLNLIARVLDSRLRGNDEYRDCFLGRGK